MFLTVPLIDLYLLLSRRNGQDRSLGFHAKNTGNSVILNPVLNTIQFLSREPSLD